MDASSSNLFRRRGSNKDPRSRTTSLLDSLIPIRHLCRRVRDPIRKVNGLVSVLGLSTYMTNEERCQFRRLGLYDLNTRPNIPLCSEICLYFFGPVTLHLALCPADLPAHISPRDLLALFSPPFSILSWTVLCVALLPSCHFPCVHGIFHQCCLSLRYQRIGYSLL